MSKLVKEEFLHVDVVGPQVMQGFYDLMNAKGDIITPSLWPINIRPGDKITMHMWPMKALPKPPRPLKRPIRPPPPPGFKYGLDGQLISLPPPPPGWKYLGSGNYLVPDVPPPPPPPPPPAVDIIQVHPGRPAKKVAKSECSVLSWMKGKKETIGKDEETELAVIDFKAVMDTVKEHTVADMLRRYTNATDVGSELIAGFFDTSESDSDTDSDGYTTDSSGSLFP
jgi:hypothetical protein